LTRGGSASHIAFTRVSDQGTTLGRLRCGLVTLRAWQGFVAIFLSSTAALRIAQTCTKHTCR
jgi:hypothetical protein